MNKSEFLESVVGFQAVRCRTPIVYYATDNAGKTFGVEDANILIRLIGGIAKGSRIDLIVHTDGGSMSAAKRVAFVLREVTDDLRVLVPYKAKSAGTILALSANRIEMGFGAELGAIDPIIRTARDSAAHGPDMISSEDIRLMSSMCREWFGVPTRDVGPLALQLLGQKIFPTTLSSFYRSQKAVYHTCEMLLRYQLPAASAKQRKQIATNLVAGPREHLDPILRAEAKELGLVVGAFDAETDKNLVKLCAAAKQFCVNFMKLEVSECSPTAIIASHERLFQYEIDTRSSPFAQKGWREL